MARLAPLLSALATEQWRDLRTLGGAGTNHFVLFALLVFATQPHSGFFLPGLVGFLLLIPASADPLRRIPAERLALLPLGPRDLTWLRAAGWGLNPVVWLTLAAILLGGGQCRAHAWLLLLLALLVHGLVRARERWPAVLLRISLFRRIPGIPGRLGGLLRKNLREAWMQLDPYVGLWLSLSGLAYRIASPGPVPEALFGLSLLVVLALSTTAQGLFALDAQRGFERYGLLPLRGWEILLAKDLAWLMILFVLLLPLAPLPGLAAGLVALSVGHRPSVRYRWSQVRWGFASGTSPGLGVLQVFLMALAGTLVHRDSPWFTLPCLGFYLASLGYFGKQLEQA